MANLYPPLMQRFRGEKIIWSSKPTASFWQYARHTPPLRERINKMDRWRNIQAGCVTSRFGYFVINFIIVGSLIGSAIAGMVSSNMFSAAEIRQAMIVGVGIWLGIVIFSRRVFQPIASLIFRNDQVWNTHYALTTQRIYWQFSVKRQLIDSQPIRIDYHFITYTNLESVILRQADNINIIEWQGQVPSGNPGHHQIAKIVFVGVDNAMALVKLVERARGKLLPLTDLRHEDKGRKKHEAHA